LLQKGRTGKSIGARDHWSQKIFEFSENVSFPRKKKDDCGNLDRRNSEEKF
jgi:hypothetical protein